MKAFTSVVLCAFIILQKTGGHVVLGNHDKESSYFEGKQLMEAKFRKNSATDLYNLYYSIEQTPDGNCIEKVVEERNGKVIERQNIVDCEKVKLELHEQEERRRKEFVKEQEEFKKEQNNFFDNIKTEFKNWVVW